MEGNSEPAYDLKLIQELVRSRRYRATGTALDGVLELGFDPTLDIPDCILALRDSDFYKSMPSTEIEGLFQDVYRPKYCNLELYVKVQVVEEDDKQKAVVISFKRK